MDPLGSLQEARDRLVALGLEADLAGMYIHLLAVGKGRPGAMAPALRLSRSETYRRLERLAGLGLAHPTQERPVMYTPAEPTTVLDLLHQRSSDRADTVLAVAQELIPLLEQLDAWQGDSAASTFRTLSGRPAIHQEIHRLLDQAAREILIVNTHPAGAQMGQRAGFWHRLRSHVQSGLHVRIMLIDGTVQALPDELLDCLRVVQLRDGWRFMIVDRQEVLMNTGIDRSSWMGSPLEQALVTAAPGFLGAQESLFSNMWDQSAPFRPRPPVSMPSAWQWEP